MSTQSRFFCVEPLYGPVDMNRIPADGNEYLYQVRTERNHLFPQSDSDSDCLPSLETPKTKFCEKQVQVGSFEWLQKEIINFRELASKLKYERQFLQKKFSCHPCPVDDEKRFCLFALGSELYKEIYEEENVTFVEGHLPLLSMVLHLTQDDVALGLKHARKWYTRIGVIHEITLWVYALFAVFHTPLSREHEEFLKDFYDELKPRIGLYSGEQKNQMYLIISLLKKYFFSSK